MFIIIGLIVVIFVGMVLYAIPNIGASSIISNQNDVNNFVTDCLDVAGEETILEFGLSGSHLPISNPFMEEVTHLLDTEPNLNENPEQTIAQNINQKFIQCIDNFKAIRGAEVTPQSTPTITAMLTQEDVALNLDYKFTVHKGDKQWTFDTFTTTIKAPMQDYLTTATEIVTDLHQTQKINLDELSTTQTTLFPLKQTLMVYTQEQNNEYVLFYANRR
jgi:hypothetical protein